MNFFFPLKKILSVTTGRVGEAEGRDGEGQEHFLTATTTESVFAFHPRPKTTSLFFKTAIKAIKRYFYY